MARYVPLLAAVLASAVAIVPSPQKRLHRTSNASETRPLTQHSLLEHGRPSSGKMNALKGLMDAVGIDEGRLGQNLRGRDGRGSGFSASGSDGESDHSVGQGPRIFFLFQTYSGMTYTDLWQAFFEGAPKERWATFLHCKDRGLCQKQIRENNALDVRLVDTVDSQYCEDLISPMVQLLRAAVKESRSDSDKFVFLSESTLPVKPFAYVAKELTTDKNSDFCIRPENTWMTLKSQLPTWFINDLRKDATLERQIMAPKLVKSSQWVVLSTAHADLLVKRWPLVKGSDTPARHRAADDWFIPVWDGKKGVVRREADGGPNLLRVSGQQQVCSDEWVLFAALYGVVALRGSANLPGLSSKELKLAGSSAPQQGVCRTFDTWGSELDQYPDAANVVSELSQDSGNHMTCEKDCETTHPAAFDALTNNGLTALRRSPYLFARKFADKNVVTLLQFRNIILSH